MQCSMGLRLCVFVTFAAFAADAWADRRSVRVDAGGWEPVVVGSADCPGTTAGLTAADTLVRRFGYVFAGHEHVEHLANVYCEVAYDDAGIDPRDAASAALGATVVSMISYSFLDDANVPDAIGFQWLFNELEDGTMIVGLHNVRLFSDPPETEILDEDSYIVREADGTEVWSGAGDNYDGEYFCFRDNTYIGTWDGDGLYPDSPCAQPTGGVIPVVANVPTLGDAGRGLLLLMFAILAVTALRRR